MVAAARFARALLWLAVTSRGRKETTGPTATSKGILISCTAAGFRDNTCSHSVFLWPQSDAGWTGRTDGPQRGGDPECIISRSLFMCISDQHTAALSCPLRTRTALVGSPCEKLERWRENGRMGGRTAEGDEPSVVNGAGGSRDGRTGGRREGS